MEVGLDVGGTSAKAWVVTGAPGARRVGAGVERTWGGFDPPSLDEQLAGAPRATDERAAAARLVATAAEAVAALVRGGDTDGDEAPASGPARSALARLGVAAAGPKTTDGRGVALWRRGPRMPRFLDELLAALAARGITPAAPVEALVDDSVAAVLGERLAAGGALRDVEDALYLGPGTDLAEAWLVSGVAGPRPEGLPAPWELVDGPMDPSEPLPGDPVVVRTLATFGDTIRLGADVDLPASFRALGRLAGQRRAATAALGLAPPARLVVGARGGALVAGEPILARAIDEGLAAAGAADLPWVASTLRAAPAIGALG